MPLLHIDIQEGAQDRKEHRRACLLLPDDEYFATRRFHWSARCDLRSDEAPTRLQIKSELRITVSYLYFRIYDWL